MKRPLKHLCYICELEIRLNEPVIHMEPPYSDVRALISETRHANEAICIERLKAALDEAEEYD